MQRIPEKPFVLTAGGLDPSGCAGVSADISAVLEMGCLPLTAITAITAQTPSKYLSGNSVEPEILIRQLEAAFMELPVAAVKLGLFLSGESIIAAAEFLADKTAPIIADPVMGTTGGKRLQSREIITAYREKLFPITTLAAPNLRELGLLAGVDITDEKGAIKAAQTLLKQTSLQSVVVTGLCEGETVKDIFIARDKKPKIFERSRLKIGRTRGTGCRFASAAACRMALGDTTQEAAERAGDWLRTKLETARRALPAKVYMLD